MEFQHYAGIKQATYKTACNYSITNTGWITRGEEKKWKPARDHNEPDNPVIYGNKDTIYLDFIYDVSVLHAHTCKYRHITKPKQSF